MKARIAAFLATKHLSANSRAAYTYDLQQFVGAVGEELGAIQVQAYARGLAGLKPSVSRRKLSAVNQFLLYLYQEGVLADYHKLTLPKPLSLPEQAPVPAQQLDLDLSVLWQGTDQASWGQVVALMIWQLGLTPSELLAIRSEDCQLDFQVLTVWRGQARRVLNLPADLVPLLEGLGSAPYLLGQANQPRSRQWLTNQLKAYLGQLGLSDLTAQGLREAYIREQVAKGLPSWELAKNLGLKTTVTLEKYYR